MEDMENRFEDTNEIIYVEPPKATLTTWLIIINAAIYSHNCLFSFDRYRF